MHHCLQISEIVDLIVAQFEPQTCWQASCLAALARTCTTFHNSALDRLWKEQRNILNLIQCMPEDLWETTDIDGDITLTPRRALIVSDWDRVLTYAHRIKFLFCCDSHANSPSNPTMIGVYLTLQRSEIPGDFLLPNLEQLWWYHHEATDSSFITLFLGSRISSIRLCDRPDGHCPALGTLLERRLDLLSVTVHSVDWESSSSQRTQLFSFVRTLPHVEFLDVRTMDCETLSHLGQLVSLKTLRVLFSRSLSIEGIPDRSMFAGLRIVRIHDRGLDISASIAFLRTWNNPRLTSFEACFRSVALENAWALYEALAAHCAHEHLHNLMVDIYPGDSPDIIPHPGYFFRPLFTFTQLRYVELQVPGSYDLDNEIISDMARAWRNIEELQLRSPAVYQPPACTLLSLEAFAQHCPRLRLLSMTLDATIVPETDLESTSVQCVRQDTLTSLDVGYSRISDPTSVARFISSNFGNLRSLTSCLSEGEGRVHRRGWQEVALFFWILLQNRKGR
ncbi:hypothetical protein K438DRAFT_1934637 [Mycena galopus ATCC 62051]|nr:hypothetical protein K438DRAFT_1934637 [Mycena galopus ATCC 62051]